MKSIKGILLILIVVMVAIVAAVIPSVDFLPLQNPTISGKSISLSYMTAVIVILYLLRSSLGIELLKITLIDISFSLLLIYITLNRYLLNGSYGFSFRYEDLLCLFALYCVLRSVADEKIFYRICLAAVIGANIQIVIGGLQLYDVVNSNSRFFKSTGSFFNSGPYACYLASVYPISLFFVKYHKTAILGERLKGAVKVALFVNIIGTLSLAPVLMSRACFIAISFASFVIYFKDIQEYANRFIFVKSYNNVLRVLSIVLVVFAMVGLFYLKQDSSNGRMLILKSSGLMVTERPVFGFGFDRFRAAYMDYQAKYLNANGNKSEALLADNTAYAFNEPVQFLVENGTVGLIFLATFMYCLVCLPAKRNDLVLLAYIGLFSIFLISLVSYPLEILPIKIVGYLYLSIIASAPLVRGTIVNLKIQNAEEAVRTKVVVQSLCAIAAGAVVVFVVNTIRVEKAMAAWTGIQRSMDNRDFKNAEQICIGLYPILSRNGDFLVDYGRVLFFNKRYDRGVSVLNQAKIYSSNAVLEGLIGDCARASGRFKEAEKAYRLASQMKPGYLSYQFSLFKLYEENEQQEQAVRCAENLLSMSIKVPSSKVDAIRNEVKDYLSKQVILHQ